MRRKRPRIYNLTCIFLTINKVPWMEFHNKVMLEAIGDYPLITISREPMPHLPGINLIQDGEQSHDNMFKQILRGAKEAKTDYVAVIEDDIFYHEDHFAFRPPLDTFAFNWNRWSLFTWGEPTFHFKRRLCGGVEIFPRLELIAALEERFAKWKKVPHFLNGEVGYDKIDKNLGVTVRKSMIFYSKTPVIQIHHIFGVPGIGRPKYMIGKNDTLDLEKRKTRKRMGMIRAYEIPYWGRSKEFVKHFI